MRISIRALRGRVDLVEGDIFERVEARADLYLLKDVLQEVRRRAAALGGRAAGAPALVEGVAR